MDQKIEVEHLPVLTGEVIDGLDVLRGGIYVDCTLGLGGHTQAILAASSGARIIGIDRDSEAIEIAGKRLSGEASRIRLVRDNFKNIKQVLSEQPAEWGSAG